MQKIIDRLGEAAKDIKLNLSSVLSESGAPGLSNTQIWGVALASAYAVRDRDLVAALKEGAEGNLSAVDDELAQKAAIIMGMNNIYYRFTHACEDETIKKLPARLRMNVIGNPGGPKVDFELYCLTVSAINGCGKCMNAHATELQKIGVSAEGIQSAVRIASVVHAASQALFIAG